MNRKDFVEWGRIGGKVKATNYRKYIIDELRKLTSKKELDMLLEYETSVLQKILISKSNKQHGQKS